MGKRPTPGEETQLLRDATREAHEAMQGLKAAVREARQLTQTLIAEFERTHEREMHQLENHLTAESNRAAKNLNQEIRTARDFIWNQIMRGQLIFDPDKTTLSLQLGNYEFQTDQPFPYPDLPAKETPQ